MRWLKIKFYRAPRRGELRIRAPHATVHSMNWLQRIIGALLGIALFIAAFVFASLVLAFAAVIALVIWGWLWWRTRGLRRTLNEREGALRERAGAVIEGEYRVEGEARRELRGGEPRED